MITALFVATLAAVGIKIYHTVQKKPETSPAPQIDPNTISEANQIPEGDPNE